MTTEDYQADVFEYENDDDLIIKKPRKRRVKTKSSAKKHKPKTKTLPKEVVEMQIRYDTVANNINATKKDWEKFYLSIEKFIMKHAYMVNFKHYIDKNSDLWGHLITSLLERIIPKVNPDGTRSCWYIDKTTNKVYPGYDREKSNIGNYILSNIKWIIFHFNTCETTIQQSLVDLNADPIPDDTVETELDNSITEKLDTIGSADAINTAINAILDMHNIAINGYDHGEVQE